MRGRTRTRISLFDKRNLGEKRASPEDERLLSDEEDVYPVISVMDGWQYEEDVPRRRGRGRQWKIGVAIFGIVAIIFVYALVQDMVANRWLQDGFKDSAQIHDKGLAIHLNPDDHSYREVKSHIFDWTVTTGVRAPDGVDKEVYLINDQFPGPVVEARSGDTLTFNIHNRLVDSQGLAMHWHGLDMQDANDMDGALGLTQSAIAQGSSKTYTFTISPEQCGTFWYHASSQLQRADGLYGGLVIHCPESQHEPISGRHDSDQLLMVSDWYHVTATDVLSWYSSYKATGKDPVPGSMVVNSGGSFDCSNVKSSLPVVCKQLQTPTLMHLPRGSTRLRLINTGSLTGFSLQAINATLTAFAVDGDNMIDGVKSTSLGVLYPGERVDILIDPVDGVTSASIQISMATQHLRFDGSPALDTLQKFPVKVSQSPMIPGRRPNVSRQVVPEIEYYNLQEAKSMQGENLTVPSQTVLLYANTMVLPHREDKPIGSFNQSSWSASTDPSVPALIDTPFEQWPDNLLVPIIKAGQWIEVVVNNMDSDGHSFHLHGHSFQVIRTVKADLGSGSYNPFDSKPRSTPAETALNKRPQVKDTVYVPAKGHVILRFMPRKGLWAFQSTSAWLQAVGMSMAFHVV